MLTIRLESKEKKHNSELWNLKLKSWPEKQKENPECPRNVMIRTKSQSSSMFSTTSKIMLQFM